MGKPRYSRYPIEWLFPVLFIVILFTAYPVAHTLWTSFHQVLIILPESPFVGLDNYFDVVQSAYFVDALTNTFWLTLISVPIILLIGLGVGRLLLTGFIGRSVVRSVLILPWALPGAIAGIVWMWIFHPSWGVLNLVLYKLGIIDAYIPWLSDTTLAGVSVIVAHVWMQFPFASVLLMAALATIDVELYEAAQIDGAGRFRSFRYITFPQIKPMLVVLAIYETLVGLTSYDLTYALTAGGPGTATTLLTYQIWKESFQMLNFGNGAALSFIMMLITLAFIVAILKAIPADIFVRN